jgi:hypothetical protein
LDRDRVIGLIAENAFRIRENLQLMEDGQLTCVFNGKDVTDKQLGWHVKSLVNLEAILAEYEHPDS